MVDIGKGTRLLCLVGGGPGSFIKEGSVFTCEEVIKNAGYPVGCEYHGEPSHCDGVRLLECLENYGPFDAHCLGCFRPLGGDLPAEIQLTTILDKIQERTTKELVPTDA